MEFDTIFLLRDLGGLYGLSLILMQNLGVVKEGNPWIVLWPTLFSFMHQQRAAGIKVS